MFLYMHIFSPSIHQHSKEIKDTMDGVYNSCTMEALENEGTAHRVYLLGVLTTASYTPLPLTTECMSHTLHRQ